MWHEQFIKDLDVDGYIYAIYATMFIIMIFTYQNLQVQMYFS